jgi:hypothetical protein
MKFEIDLKMFYKVGIVCFMITSICSLANMFIYWGVWNFFSKSINVAQWIFNLTLVGLFYYLLKGLTNGQNTAPSGTSVEDVAKAFEEAEKPGKRGLK